mmetsp:Transcript_93272/g.150603  ORF Transcript_93272/g.150603 Transcript_93272/m.150603 type:complete len:82 (-) Transcript_93272:112-357(-)
MKLQRCSRHREQSRRESKIGCRSATYMRSTVQIRMSVEHRGDTFQCPLLVALEHGVESLCVATHSLYLCASFTNPCGMCID